MFRTIWLLIIFGSDHISIAGQVKDEKFLYQESEPIQKPTGYSDAKHQKLDQYLGSTSIIYALSKNANRTLLGEKCFNDLKSIERGILDKQPWALKVLDSSGNREPGFIWGNDYWLGSQLGCTAVHNPLRITLSSDFERATRGDLISNTSPFPMGYQVLYMKHNSPWQVEPRFSVEKIIHLGLCLPSDCSSEEIQNLTTSLIVKNLFDEPNLFELNLEVLHVKDLKLKNTFWEQSILRIVMVWIVVQLLLNVAARFLNKYEDDANKAKDQQKQPISPKLAAFIRCFDIAKNCRTLFTIQEPPANAIKLIDGIKTLLCCWIIMVHVYVFQFSSLKSKSFLAVYLEKPYFQFLPTFYYAVDGFFTVSAFIQTSFFIRDQRGIEVIRGSSLLQNVKSFTTTVFSRYLRFAPVYLTVAGVTSVFTAYARDVSIFHVHYDNDQLCAKYWWRNVLLVQNFFNEEEMCLNWSWSLANEMQFSIFMLALLYIYAKNPKLAKRLMILSIVTTIAWQFRIGLKTKYQFSFDKIYSTLTDVYMNPFVRILPYLIGSSAGWYFAEQRGKIVLSPRIEKHIWTLAIFSFLVALHINNERNLSSWLTVVLQIMSRTLIAGSVSWMIIGSATGRGVWWSRMLEHKIFQHFHRLTYAAYLINPLIISIVYSLSNSSSNVDIALFSVVVCGFWVLTYLGAIIFFLVFEMPYSNLRQVLLKEKRKLD